MRSPLVALLLALLLAGCTEHGSTPPDAAIKEFLDAQVTTCVAPDGGARVTTSPGSAFGRVYAGGVLLAGPVAPARSAGVPLALRLLFTNVAQADLGILDNCDGNLPNCTTEGLAVSATLERDLELGAHPASLRATTGARPLVQGTLTVTEFVNPFDTLPGHITGTVSATGAIVVTGSFSTVFCPPFLSVTI